MNYFAHPTAVIDEPATIGAGTKIWHFSHICEGATVGENCVIGQNVMIAGGVTIGNHVKIQNNVSVYTGITIEDEVFLGPSCVLTNVTNPRAEIGRRELFEHTLIRRGATIGANATVVCGVTVGRYAFIGAGAVLTRGSRDYALMIGVPARRVGWMSRHGHPLKPSGDVPEGLLVCPESGFRYREEHSRRLRCLDLDEDAPLPPEHAVGKRSYGSFRSRTGR